MQSRILSVLGLVVAGCFCTGVPARAEERHALADQTRPGEQYRIRLEMKLEGHLLVRSGDKTTTLPLNATARHDFVERLLDVADGHRPVRAARHYDQAQAVITVHGVSRSRELRPERRLQVAQVVRQETVTYCPHGPMTREEQELIGQHFNTLALSGLLPTREVALGETWTIPAEVAQHLAGVDALIGHELEGRLESVNGSEAVIRVRGKIEGISSGAEVLLEVTAKLTVDRDRRRWIAAQWKQKEQRGHGPVSPASRTETTIRVSRDLNDQSAKLPEEVLAGLPAEPEEGALLLVFRDARGRWEFLHDRHWHLVTQTDQYAVLRLIQDGELLGQLNITPLPKAKRGEHISVEEVRRLVQNAPGLRIEQVLQAGEVPAEKGYWIYRLSVAGRADDLPIVQNVYAVAGPDGDQILMAFTTEVGQVERFGVRDLAIVGSVTFAPAR